MKRIAVVTVVAVAFAVAAIVLADGMGAVQKDLLEKEPVETNEVVGWAIANSTGIDEIQVQIHVDNGRPDTVFDVTLRNSFNYPAVDPTFADVVLQKLPDVLVTNEEGIGNYHAVTTIEYPQGANPEDFEWVDMKVFVLEQDLGIRYAARFDPRAIPIPTPIPIKP